MPHVLREEDRQHEGATEMHSGEEVTCSPLHMEGARAGYGAQPLGTDCTTVSPGPGLNTHVPGGQATGSLCCGRTEEAPTPQVSSSILPKEGMDLEGIQKKIITFTGGKKPILNISSYENVYKTF